MERVIQRNRRIFPRRDSPVAVGLDKGVELTRFVQTICPVPSILAAEAAKRLPPDYKRSPKSPSRNIDKLFPPGPEVPISRLKRRPYGSPRLTGRSRSPRRARTETDEGTERNMDRSSKLEFFVRGSRKPGKPRGEAALQIEKRNRKLEELRS